MSTANLLTDLTAREFLSADRYRTYYLAANSDADKAWELYGWNARVSAALMLPAHFVEIAVRNAVTEALTAEFGQDWPWNEGFLRALPNPPRRQSRFNPQRELERVRSQPSTGKAVAELKFVFWCKMFEQRHDDRVWKRQIHRVFTHAPSLDALRLRADIQTSLDQVRRLRNRTAHHEPVLRENLPRLMSTMDSLIRYRSPEAADWLAAHEGVSSLLAQRPLT